MSALSVLVVDDDETVRLLVGAYLDGEADLQVVASADSGHAALRAAAASSPDVIVIDDRMPDGTGLDVLPALRSACPRARIVMFTSDVDVEGRALELGADAFVDKTQTFDRLAQRLRS